MKSIVPEIIKLVCWGIVGAITLTPLTKDIKKWQYAILWVALMLEIVISAFAKQNM